MKVITAYPVYVNQKKVSDTWSNAPGPVGPVVDPYPVLPTFPAVTPLSPAAAALSPLTPLPNPTALQIADAKKKGFDWDKAKGMWQKAESLGITGSLLGLLGVVPPPTTPVLPLADGSLPPVSTLPITAQVPPETEEQKKKRKQKTIIIVSIVGVVVIGTIIFFITRPKNKN